MTRQEPVNEYIVTQLWHVLTIQKQHTPNEPHDLLQELQEKLLGNYLEISIADNLLKESEEYCLRLEVHTAVEMSTVAFRVVMLCSLVIYKTTQCQNPQDHSQQ
jgi:hypothetical protein